LPAEGRGGWRIVRTQTTRVVILASLLGSMLVAVMSSSPAQAQGSLTGRDRERFITASSNSCFKAGRSESSDLNPDALSRYCSCYSNRMADSISPDEAKWLTSASREEIQRAMQPRIDNAIAACLPTRTVRESSGGSTPSRSPLPSDGNVVPRREGNIQTGRDTGPIRSTPPPASTVDGPSGPIRVALRSSGGVLVVPVLINNAITLDFVVDSGASSVSIPADVALTLSRAGTIEQQDLTGSETFVTATGERTRSPTFVIRSLKIGGVTVRNVQAAVSPAKGDLLLGQSFLRQFRSWHVDNRTNELVLVQ
jgi:clan AA aspartic protease (TIGR02281 family)